MTREATDGAGFGLRELEILNAVAESLNASVDLAESLRSSLGRVAELLGLRTGWVWLLDEESGEPYLAATQELPPGLADNPGAMEGSCHCLDQFQRGDLDGAANVVTCSRLKWLRDGSAGLRYHASIPLHARGRRLGVMNVATTEWRALTAEELRLLHIVGEMVGVAVERAQLYARSVEAGAANERNRLAREIHDTLAQSLSAIALQLEAAEEMLQAGQPAERVETRVSAALRVARTSLDDARRSVLDLRAAPLEGRSLAEALRELASATREDESGVAHVEFEAVGEAAPLPSRLEVGLYRIAQEALSNAARHSRASLVRVRFAAEPGRATLVIEDDGAGFDPAATVVGRFGLVGMRERARLLGGTLTVESTIGAGTRIRAVMPLDDGASFEAPPALR